ncbi:MAG: DUF4430 domain-containing protein [Gaiellaceae bacterium]
MFRRSLALMVAAVVAAVASGAVLAAGVQIRVEGKTRTIFGAAQPRVEASNPLEALEAASLAGEFYYHVTTTSFGPYVDQVARFPATGTTGWVFKVNGASPPVGADKVELKDGDVVLWYWAQFGIVAGGPPTLELQRRPKGCYQAFKLDDNGARTVAAGATLLVDGRRVATRGGRACLKPRHGLVRAVLEGAVRSNAVR